MTLCSWEEHVQSNQGDVQKSMKTPSWSRSWDSMDISAFPKDMSVFWTLRLSRSV